MPLRSHHCAHYANGGTARLCEVDDDDNYGILVYLVRSIVVAAFKIIHFTVEGEGRGCGGSSIMCVLIPFLDKVG